MPTPTAPDQPNADRTLKLVLVVMAVFFALIVFAAVVGQNTGKPGPVVDVLDDMADTMTPTMPLDNTMDAAAPTPAATPAGPWSYSTDEDKVRGATSYYATTTSTNAIHQAAPYDGDTTMTITVRQSRAFGTDVLLSISQGQMMCPSYEGCSGTVRFDDGPAQPISFNGPADNSSETVFVESAHDFIAKLKKAKKVVIEKTLYQAGNPQFEFDVAGLKWDH